MADNTIPGATGNITIPGAGTHKIASFTLNTGRELLDDSGYGDGGWRSRVAALRDLSGTAIGFLQKTADPLADRSGSMVLTFDTGYTITFDCVIGNIQIVSEYAGLNVVTYNFSKTGSALPATLWPAPTP